MSRDILNAKVKVYNYPGSTLVCFPVYIGSVNFSNDGWGAGILCRDAATGRVLPNCGSQSSYLPDKRYWIATSECRRP